LPTDRGEDQSPGIRCIRAEGTATREGRNPATGAPLTIAAKKMVRFKFSKATEDRINGKKAGALARLFGMQEG